MIAPSASFRDCETEFIVRPSAEVRTVNFVKITNFRLHANYELFTNFSSASVFMTNTYELRPVTVPRALNQKTAESLIPNATPLVNQLNYYVRNDRASMWFS